MFTAVDYNRSMSWKAGAGSIGMGVSELSVQKTATDAEGVLLPGGRSVFVVNTMFKLVPL